MKKIFVAILLGVSLLAACAVVPVGRGHHHNAGVAIVPILPPLVVLEAQPYYFYNGFHYHYVDGSWFYAKSKNGPWAALPRDHYPKEVRFKGKSRKRDHERDRDRHDNGGRRWD